MTKENEQALEQVVQEEGHTALGTLLYLSLKRICQMENVEGPKSIPAWNLMAYLVTQGMVYDRD